MKLSKFNKAPSAKSFNKSYNKGLNITQKKQVTRIVRTNLETKIFDVTSGLNIPCDSINGIRYNITSAMAAGTSEFNVIGSKITPIGVRVRYTINFPAVNPDTFNVIRFFVIQMKGSRFLTMGDLVAITGGASQTPISETNLKNNNEYRVLKTFTRKIDAAANNGYNGTFYIKAKQMRRISFVSASVPNLEDGGIYVYMVSDSNVPGHPEITMYTRLYFKDA